MTDGMTYGMADGWVPVSCGSCGDLGWALGPAWAAVVLADHVGSSHADERPPMTDRVIALRVGDVVRLEHSGRWVVTALDLTTGTATLEALDDVDAPG